MRPLHNVWKCLTAVVQWITAVGFALGCISLGSLIAIYIYEVGCRYLLNSPTTWASDITSYLLSISVFLCMPQVTAEGGHVAITIIIDKSPRNFKHPIELLLKYVAGILCVVVAGICAIETTRQIMHGTLTIATHPIQKWWISVFIVYGFTGSAWHFFHSMGNNPIKEKIGE